MIANIMRTIYSKILIKTNGTSRSNALFAKGTLESVYPIAIYLIGQDE